MFLNSDNNEKYYFQFINSSYYYEEFFRPRTLTFKIVENESYLSVAEIFETEYIADCIYFVCIKLLSEDVKLNKCGNCGKYFSPQKRSDTLYCNRPSPRDNSMSCKEYGAKKLWYERLKDNESVKLYRNIYSAKLMLSKTNPHIQEYKKNFEKYKIDAKQWLKDVKTGIKTEKEFIIWLKSVRGKRDLE